ncbi:hypothetical protein [Mobiluncus mulieris]|nr:hypothetical protein [Mobiluncus mulieris]
MSVARRRLAYNSLDVSLLASPRNSRRYDGFRIESDPVSSVIANFLAS